MFRSIYWATPSLPSFQAWPYDSASEHDVCETFRRARGLLLPFYCSNRPRLPALWTIDADFGDRLHFGGFAQTGTNPKHAKWATTRPSLQPGAPWRQTLKRWKPIRISPNLRTKQTQKGMKMMRVTRGDRGPWDLFLGKRKTLPARVAPVLLANCNM